MRSNRFVTAIILENSRLVRLGVRRRRWLLPPFVRTNIPLPVTRNRFAVALWVLSLYFFTFYTPGHYNTAQWRGAGDEKIRLKSRPKWRRVTSFFLFR